MIHALDDVRAGYDLDADAVVVGSGPGGAVAAANLSKAGMRVVVVEAGPEVKPEDMTRNAPLFLARYFWEGALRMVGGSNQSPSMQARCLGGSSVVNSAIMLPLPDWVRRIWAEQSGSEQFTGPALDDAYQRIFEGTKTAPTPMAVMGRRNLIVKEALDSVGISGAPLPRAVEGCAGCSDCLTGCAGGHKQSMDRSYLPRAVADGAEVFTCSHVDRVDSVGARATGVGGWIVDPRGRKRLARFRVRAKNVVMAAGAMHTPVILLQSGIDVGGTVGSTFFAHIGGGLVGLMDEVVDPWVGATQGWGAISREIRGMKYEGLWAPPAALMTRWGDVGEAFLARLHEVKHATCIAAVYRGNVRGRVTAKRNGMPNAKMWVPKEEVHVVMRGLKIAADALLGVGAERVLSGVPGAVDEMRTTRDTESLLDPRIGPKHLAMTLNHIFGSCRMSRSPGEGTVDETGRVHGVEGLYIVDASIFPSPSAVNPQATIMALSDLITRKLGELDVENTHAT